MTDQVYSQWRKSTRSDANGNCVEVSPSNDGSQIGVRDTKDRSGPMLEIDTNAWASFIEGVRAGEFDL